MGQILQIEHLKKQFEEFTVLDDIGFSVDRGQVVVVVNVSPAGKIRRRRLQKMNCFAASMVWRKYRKEK